MKGSESGQTREFALLKLDMARGIEDQIDNIINESGVTSKLSENPVIIDWLADNVSENLARKVANSGGDLRTLRSLQKDYYRMGEIARLSQLESSGLGKGFFSWISKIPVIGEAAEGLLQPIESGAATGASILLDKASNIKAPNVSMPGLNINPNQISRYGSQGIVQSLQENKPGLDLGRGGGYPHFLYK